MKKTIAILLVLVLAGVGLFADNNQEAPTTSHNATITINTKISTIASFGLSPNRLTPANYLSLTAFNDAVSVTRDITSQDMTNFTKEFSVGFLSGINNTLSDIDLSITVSPFTSNTAKSASIPLSVSPTKAKILKATDKMGKLTSTEMKVIETTAGTIELAPAADDYTATVTISITNPA